MAAVRATPALRFIAVLLGYALAGLVGYSRLMIHAHSTSEVIAGLLLGAAGSAAFLLLQLRVRDTHTAQLSFGGLASMIIIPALLLNTGAKAPTQSLLGEIAVKLGPLEKPLPVPTCIMDFTDLGERGRDEGFRVTHVLFTLHAI